LFLWPTKKSKEPEALAFKQTMVKQVPHIELENVVKRYPVGKNEFYQALNGVSLKVNQGDFIAIMGPSGSGKSTLMHIMGALDTPTSGNQYFKGKNIASYSENQLAEVRNKEIGFVFQSFNLLSRTSVLKNVERPMMYAGIPPKERNNRALATLAQMGIADKAENLSNHISGGQIQRVAIARALVMNPSIILADEPTGNLDTKTATEIMNIFTNLNQKGSTVVVITHEPDIAAFAKSRIHLVDGKIVKNIINSK
jgi:putative ABC transport system ATP-binding protein